MRFSTVAVMASKLTAVRTDRRVSGDRLRFKLLHSGAVAVSVSIEAINMKATRSDKFKAWSRLGGALLAAGSVWLAGAPAGCSSGDPAKPVGADGGVGDGAVVPADGAAAG